MDRSKSIGVVLKERTPTNQFLSEQRRIITAEILSLYAVQRQVPVSYKMQRLIHLW